MFEYHNSQTPLDFQQIGIPYSFTVRQLDSMIRIEGSEESINFGDVYCYGMYGTWIGILM